MGKDKIVIEIVFSKHIDTVVAQAIANGELKDKQDLLRRLAGVYQKEIKNNKEFMKPLKALDKDVAVRVIISEE